MKLDVENKAWLAFVVSLLLAGAAVAVWYAVSARRYATYQVLTHDSVSGLLVDAPVEYHGVDVGRVERVDLIDARSVRILLAVHHAAPVSAATVATITTRGLAARGFTGYVYVSLEDAGSGSGSLVPRPGEEYPVIPMTPAKSMSLDTAIARMDENMQRITERLDDVLDAKTVAALRQAADDLQRATRALAGNSDKLNALIVNGERASRELQPLLASSNETLDILRTQILPETHRTLTSLDSVNRDLRPLLQSSNDTLNALQTQTLPEAHRTLTDLDNLSISLTGFANKMNRDPSVIIRGAALRPPGPGEAQ